MKDSDLVKEAQKREVSILSDGSSLISQRKLAALLGVKASTLKMHIARDHREANTRNGLDENTAFQVTTYFAYESKVSTQQAKDFLKVIGSAGIRAYNYHLAGVPLSAPVPTLTPLEQAAETMKMLSAEIIAEREDNQILNQFIDNTMNGEQLVSFETATKLIYNRYAFQIGRNTLMKALRDVGVLMDNNNPYQRYSHWFKVVKKRAASGNVYNVTLIYEDKIKMIYKYAMQEFKTIEL